MWYCEQQLQRFNAGEAIDVSLASIYRWADCLEPFRQTGNRARARILGVDLLSLVTYITAWPDATLDEMAVFIYNEGGGLYSCQAISTRLGELDITKTESVYRRLPDATARRAVLRVGILGLPPPPWHFSGATKKAH